jgi:hypothetical protein
MEKLNMENRIEANLHVYDVVKCGLYYGRSGEHKHMHLGGLIKELKGWISLDDKPLIETSTYSDSAYVMSSYCMAVEKHGGQYLIAMWNKVEHLKSGVGMVNGSASTNEIKVSRTKIGKTDIPGYPSYFWVLPSSNTIVGVLLDNPSFAINQLRNYLTGFLLNFSSHAVRSVEDPDTVKGFSDFPRPKKGKDERVVNTKLIPQFNMLVKKIPGKYDELKDRYDDVTKIVKDVYVFDDTTDDKSSYVERIKSVFNGISPIVKKKLRVEMPVKLVEADVDRFINKYEDSGHEDASDVGFVLKGQSSRIEWLSGSTQKEKVVLKLKWISKDNPDLLSLSKELKKNIEIIIDKGMNDEQMEKTG